MLEVKSYGDLNDKPYLVSSHSILRDSESILSLVKEDLLEMRKICVVENHTELISIIDNAQFKLCVDQNEMDNFADSDIPHMWLYDLATDYIQSSRPGKDPKVFALSEALYGLAADYYLSWYISEPILGLTCISFKPYFELWKSGVSYYLTERFVYVSAPSIN